MTQKAQNPIDAEKIKRYMDAMNYMLTFERNGFLKSDSFKTIRKQYGISTNVLTAMVSCGYLKRISLGNYKVILPKLEPIHGKSLIISCRDMEKNKKKVKKVETETKRVYFKRTDDNVDRYQIACQKIVDHIKKTSRSLDPATLKINCNIKKAMIIVGLIEKVDRLQFKALVSTVTRDQAKDVLSKSTHMSMHGRNNSIGIRKQTSKIEKPIHVTPSKPISPVKQTSKLAHKPKKQKGNRTFSILWGLIKFNY